MISSASAVSKAIGCSVIDNAFRRYIIVSKLFTDGWGRPNVLQSLLELHNRWMSRRHCNELITSDDTETLQMTKTDKYGTSSTDVYIGKFRSPLARIYPDIIECPVSDACFVAVFPKKWSTGGRSMLRPLCIHLAGTGEHSYWRRRVIMAAPLCEKHGIGSIILQNPFYGERRPPQQRRSSLLYVSDLFVMGASLVLECLVLLRWAERNGFGPLGLTGFSMGGHMACLAASNWPKPVSLAPCLSWTNAWPVYTQGALSAAIPWPILQKQLESERFISETQKLCGSQWFDQMKSINIGIDNHRCSEARQMMRVLMEQFTDLSRVPAPIDPSIAKVTVAERDGYVPRNGVSDFRDIWPQCDVEVIRGRGHITAYLMCRRIFRDNLVHVLRLNARKYYGADIL